MGRNATSYGRFQVAEPPHNLLFNTHLHDDTVALRTVDHEPRVAVLDQEDLLKQGIYTDLLIPGAQRVDALGSCTANAFTVAVSNVLYSDHWIRWSQGGGYQDTVGNEKAAIRFYHACTDQTGDPSTEWPPTDCGSSGPFIVQEAVKQGLISRAVVVSGAQHIVSLMQSDGLLMGSPWLNCWEEPDINGFVDGDGKASTLQKQLQMGIAGGHETFLAAIEKLAFFPGTLVVDPWNTVIRDRNSWSKAWGDNGSCRFHLSTIVALGRYIDLRQLKPVVA